ncbi:hypothetical protein [Shigella boydii]
MQVKEKKAKGKPIQSSFITANTAKVNKIVIGLLKFAGFPEQHEYPFIM